MTERITKKEIKNLLYNIVFFGIPLLVSSTISFLLQNAIGMLLFAPLLPVVAFILNLVEKKNG